MDYIWKKIWAFQIRRNGSVNKNYISERIIYSLGKIKHLLLALNLSRKPKLLEQNKTANNYGCEKQLLLGNFSMSILIYTEG